MARKPERDIGAAASSKVMAAATMPFAAPTAPAVALRVGGGVKSLTVKLEGDLYAALCTYCYQREHATGTNLTHRQVMVEALKAFLPKPMAQNALL